MVANRGEEDYMGSRGRPGGVKNEMKKTFKGAEECTKGAEKFPMNNRFVSFLLDMISNELSPLVFSHY